MTAAMCREAKEELGIAIAHKDLHFATMAHKYTLETGETYVNVFFSCSQWQGSVRRNEPEKCAELKWFPVEGLPEDLLEDRKTAIACVLQNLPYHEIGWE